jgi:hypothetical protein
LNAANKRVDIDKYSWFLLGGYLLAWILVIGPNAGWALAVIAGAGYAGGQLWSIRRSGHIHTSADPIALPAGLLAHVGGIGVLTLLGHEPVASARIWVLMLPFASAWIVGHIAAFAVAAAADWFERRAAKSDPDR